MTAGRLGAAAGDVLVCAALAGAGAGAPAAAAGTFGAGAFPAVGPAVLAAGRVDADGTALTAFEDAVAGAALATVFVGPVLVGPVLVGLALAGVTAALAGVRPVPALAGARVDPGAAGALEGPALVPAVLAATLAPPVRAAPALVAPGLPAPALVAPALAAPALAPGERAGVALAGALAVDRADLAADPEAFDAGLDTDFAAFGALLAPARPLDGVAALLVVRPPRPSTLATVLTAALAAEAVFDLPTRLLVSARDDPLCDPVARPAAEALVVDCFFPVVPRDFWAPGLLGRAMGGCPPVAKRPGKLSRHRGHSDTARAGRWTAVTRPAGPADQPIEGPLHRIGVDPLDLQALRPAGLA